MEKKKATSLPRYSAYCHYSLLHIDHRDERAAQLDEIIAQLVETERVAQLEKNDVQVGDPENCLT